MCIRDRLREASEVYTGKIEGSSDSYLRVRDIKKVVGHKMVLRVLAVESQTHVDYTMPWRCFNYDSLEYGVQIKPVSYTHLLIGRMRRKVLTDVLRRIHCLLYTSRCV